MSLEGLTLEELKRLKSMIDDVKRERLIEARNKRLHIKASCVATYLGKAYGKKYGNYWIYPDPQKEEVFIHELPKEMDFVIAYDDYGNNLDVYYKGKLVLEEHLGNLVKYIPGEWENMLEELYSKVEKIEKESEKRSLMKEITETAEEWGIDVGELVRKVKEEP